MIVWGSGHRPNKLGGHGAVIAQRLVKLAHSGIEQVKPDVVISGMALGWDQALAAAAKQQGKELWAYVPFEGQEKMWPALAQKLYRELLARADVVRIVTSGGFAGWKMQTRNEAMVDGGDHGLVLWNGSAGGTANCVRYAEQRGKPYTNLWPQWSET